jgi:hypothetical protein
MSRGAGLDRVSSIGSKMGVHKMAKTTAQANKALVLEAFDTLFNKRDYRAAERYWSANYLQHSAHIKSRTRRPVRSDPEFAGVVEI